MSGLITIPKASSAAALVVEQRADFLRNLVPTGTIDPNLWLASLMVEVNALTKPCTSASVGIAALNAAFLGLQFGKSLGHAYIIPYGQEATLVVGYKGFRHLAFETGFLKTMHAEVVCRGEEFVQWVDENGPHFRHVPAHERSPSRDDITHAYLVYTTRDGGQGVKIVPRSEINRSDKGRDVWKSDYQSMCLKTAVLKASKQWNTTSRLAHAVALDEETERDARQSSPPGISVEEMLPKPTSFSLPTGAPVNENIESWRVTIGFCDTAAKLDKLSAELSEMKDLSKDELAAIDVLFAEQRAKLQPTKKGI